MLVIGAVPGIQRQPYEYICRCFRNYDGEITTETLYYSVKFTDYNAMLPPSDEIATFKKHMLIHQLCDIIEK